MFILFSFWVPDTFLQWDTWKALLDSQAVTAILALGRRLGRRRTAPAVLAHPFFCLRGGAIVDGQVMATLVLEVACHGVAHDAKTEKSCFRHPALPLKCATRAHCRAPAPIPISAVIATARARRQR